MTRQIIAFLLSSWLCGSAVSQQSYVVGFIDHKDSRTQSTGIETLLGENRNVRRLRFDLENPTTWNIEGVDMIIVGSFSERAPGWQRFVDEAKPRVLDFVRTGGVLVRMCRARLADDRAEGGVYFMPNLLPPGYTVHRSSREPNRLFVSERSTDIWRGMSTRSLDNDWHQLGLDRVGSENTYFLDAFDVWSDQFKKNAGDDRRHGRQKYAAGLHASFGKGWLLLFQVALDKVDGMQGTQARGHAKDWCENLIAWGRDAVGPRVKTEPPVIAVEPVPVPRTEPAKPVPPVVETPPERRRVEVVGRVFLDLDDDARFDAGEVPIVGAEVVYATSRADSDARGAFRLVADEVPGAPLEVRPPDGYEVTSEPYLPRAGAAVQVDVACRRVEAPAPIVPAKPVLPAHPLVRGSLDRAAGKS